MTYRIYSRLCRPSYESKWKKICKKFWFYKTYHMEKASIMWKNILYWIFFNSIFMTRIWVKIRKKYLKNCPSSFRLIWYKYGDFFKAKSINQHFTGRLQPYLLRYSILILFSLSFSLFLSCYSVSLSHMVANWPF